MTREEIEKISEVEPYCFETDGEKTWYEIGYNDGLKATNVELLLKSIWHDAGEEPEEGINILCLSKKGSINLVSNINEWLYNWLKNESNLDKWAYISDLLPKGGEK